MENYIGEIRMFGGQHPPSGWVFCEGQTLSIQHNQVLFALLGNVYGGDGQTTFNLPDLRGRLPVGVGTDQAGQVMSLGQQVGSETVNLTLAQIPSHKHTIQVSTTAGTSPDPSGKLLAAGDLPGYKAVSSATEVQFNSNAVAVEGSSMPHDNVMPSLAINFIIATQGIFPTTD